jgi:transposase
MGKAKKRYTPAPEVAPEMGGRLGKILQVLAGAISVAQAARELGMSRNHFQTLLHRALGGLTEAITPRPAGRPAKPAQVSSLQQRLAVLERENARLKERVGTTDRLLQAASGLLQGRIRPVRQSRARRPAVRADEDPDPEPRRERQALEVVEHMRALGMSLARAAGIAGVHPSTVRRWKARGSGTPTRHGRETPVTPQAARQLEEALRTMHGLPGADSLAHTVPGISRRQAARLKARTLTAMERERKAALHRVRVSAPGVVRSLDGMMVQTAHGARHALVSSDAAVPYRTGIVLGTRYDGHLVARALAADMQRNGAPLVYRLDRAKAHDTQQVREVLATAQVLVPHGPPHCPRFYGQHERQNREHRAWLRDDYQGLPDDEVEAYLWEMAEALNGRWRRRSLGWNTAREAWDSRAAVNIDRMELRNEVHERAAHLERHLQLRGKPADLAWRLAIEQALESRGLLQLTAGGWC